METRVLKGRPIAAGIVEEVGRRAAALAGRGVQPCLAVVCVGDDPASAIYSASIERAGGGAGIDVRVVRLPAGAGTDGAARALAALAGDPLVHGIIVQQPLPRGVDPSVVDAVPAAKDVDCAAAGSLGLLARGAEVFAPCTALAVVEALAAAAVPIEGAHVVVVGRSAVVGRPLALLLLRKGDRGNATVTVCHTGTRDLATHTLRADVLVAAMGRPEAIRGDMVREGAVVVDVGVNRVEDATAEKGFRVVGDVAFQEVLGRAAVATPVPGGVGALTTAILLRNTVRAAEARARER
ncbi:MAG: bifunctional 5,10-methylene-tetrahydrofolate dehydrogenase/5,10-methylene-tetrahydrofolate cyclohydrolase [Candidatus Eisenbacteria bacterium]|nr:bifunctional 5,10-methylene-tetrahydrofolate dehydrogenase/5,10-methylene-tetrahydrofolate cyclohydrolase [Candidatus Eisenbacteria bacterium]